MSKIYFASDFHLGVPNDAASLKRERQIVKWLDLVLSDADELLLVGDVFDFWFEYKKVIPKGFSRLFGKLAEIADRGIQIHFFTGNHDLWLLDYFQKEFGIQVHTAPQVMTWDGISCFVGHGDGLGPGDKGYKRMKKVFTNSISKWLFRWLHPDIGVSIANSWSRSSRVHNKEKKTFLGPDKEWLMIYANKKLETSFHDYFIFGHRHVPIFQPLNNPKSTFVNLGDWIHHQSYAVLENGQISLKYFKDES